MAVPKKKRYKQIVRERRFLQRQRSLAKNFVWLTKFVNYTTAPVVIGSRLPCFICQNKKWSRELCASCYVETFLSLYVKRYELQNKKYRTRDLVYEYYVNLSKTFFPSSGS
jgi:hypothetical protein